MPPMPAMAAIPPAEGKEEALPVDAAVGVVRGVTRSAGCCTCMGLFAAVWEGDVANAVVAVAVAVAMEARIALAKEG